MATHLPNLKDLDLFIDVYTLLKNHELSLNAVARDLMKSASTISECISSLESYYHIPLVISKGGVARPTKEADDAVEKFQRIIRLAQTLQEEGQTKTTEIRIATTHSLRHRLLRGSIAAFMWWLKKHCNGIQNTVRVDVQAFDHNEVMHRLAERGVHAYHWGVCWHLPQARFNSYLDFKEIPFPTDELRKARPRTARDKEYVSIKAADCATPVVALTSHLEYGGQAKNLVELFESSSIIERNDILKVLPEARVALLQSEPEDEFRQSIVPLVNASIAVRVQDRKSVV